MNFSGKAAYIKGLADGLDYNKESAEGKLIAALIDAVGEMATEIERLNDYIEEIDECLGDVEDYLADECDCDDDCDCDCDDCHDDCDCDECEEYYEAECPNCGETFEIDADDLGEDSDEVIICPHCGKKLIFDEEELGDEDEDGEDK